MSKNEINHKCTIIAGFAGIGKTTLSKKYRNVFDLESSPYRWDNTNFELIPAEQRKGLARNTNPLWPQNYIDAIKQKSQEYDILLVWVHPEALDVYEQHNIPYIICIPELSALDIYRQRFIDRGNNDEYVNKVADPADFKMRLSQWATKPNKKIVLKGNETLESYLISQKFILVK